jgi:hypothetical protein
MVLAELEGLELIYMFHTTTNNVQVKIKPDAMSPERRFPQSPVTPIIAYTAPTVPSRRPCDLIDI